MRQRRDRKTEPDVRAVPKVCEAVFRKVLEKYNAPASHGWPNAALTSAMQFMAAPITPNTLHPKSSTEDQMLFFNNVMQFLPQPRWHMGGDLGFGRFGINLMSQALAAAGAQSLNTAEQDAIANLPARAQEVHDVAERTARTIEDLMAIRSLDDSRLLPSGSNLPIITPTVRRQIINEVFNDPQSGCVRLDPALEYDDVERMVDGWLDQTILGPLRALYWRYKVPVLLLQNVKALQGGYNLMTIFYGMNQDIILALVRQYMVVVNVVLSIKYNFESLQLDPDDPEKGCGDSEDEEDDEDDDAADDEDEEAEDDDGRHVAAGVVDSLLHGAKEKAMAALSSRPVKKGVQIARHALQTADKALGSMEAGGVFSTMKMGDKANPGGGARGYTIGDALEEMKEKNKK